ncbi:MAG: helix-turn-helix domain-containing protein, partial [Solirubrobacterales bacterium]|nr:helix-turn-helix domain-containing protein [Solirubrobacterales bacterium]
MTQAYRFCLEPTPAEARRLASHAGAARFAYNRGLARVEACLKAREWERRLLGASVTEVPWSLAALRREWNAEKQRVAPWWAENSKEAYSSGLDALARGLRAFSDSRNGKRRGPRVGFPRRKRRGRSREGFR